MRILRTAVIGVGYLGKYHAEKFKQLPHSTLVAVCDTDVDAATKVATELGVAMRTDYRSLIGTVDAVSIVVPTQWHYEIALFFLEQGVHVLLEKPMTETVEQADRLIAVAQERGVVLQVGHLERFNPVVQAILQYKESMSGPLLIECRRLGPFKPRGLDVSVVLDLMIHDLEILLSLETSRITRLQAMGHWVLSKQIDVAYVDIEFFSGTVANLCASRLHPVTERTWSIIRPEQYCHANLDNKVINHQSHGSEIVVETFAATDVLRDEIADFLTCILEHRRPLVGGAEARRALALAHAINKKICGDVV